MEMIKIKFNENSVDLICDKCGAHLELKCPNKHCTDCGAVIYGDGKLCSLCVMRRQCLACDSICPPVDSVSCHRHNPTMESIGKNLNWLDNEPHSMPGGIGI